MPDIIRDFFTQPFLVCSVKLNTQREDVSACGITRRSYCVFGVLKGSGEIFVKHASLLENPYECSAMACPSPLPIYQCCNIMSRVQCRIDASLSHISHISYIVLPVSAQWHPTEIPASFFCTQLLGKPVFEHVKRIVDLIATLYHEKLHSLRSSSPRCSPRLLRDA